MTELEGVFTDQELANLTELREVLSTANSPGWSRIMKRLEELVEEAHESMVGAADAPDLILAAKARRWTQREAVVRDIKGYIASCQTSKDEILKSLDRSVPRAEPD